MDGHLLPADRLTEAAELLADGYTIVRGAVRPSLIAEIEADLSDRFEATPFCEGGFYGERTKRFGRLLIRSEGTTALVLDPLVSTTRAPTFYQRLGFVFVERRMFDEDDCLVHKLTREDWSKRSGQTPETPKSK